VASQAPLDGSLHRARDSSSSESTTAPMARRGFLVLQPGGSWTGPPVPAARGGFELFHGCFPPFPPFLLPLLPPFSGGGEIGGKIPMGGVIQGGGPTVWLYRAALGFPGRGMDGGQSLASAPKGTRRSSRGARQPWAARRPAPRLRHGEHGQREREKKAGKGADVRAPLGSETRRWFGDRRASVG
jgi:hypothetical protein